MTHSTLLYPKSLKPGGYLNLKHISRGRPTLHDQEPVWLVGATILEETLRCMWFPSGNCTCRTHSPPPGGDGGSHSPEALLGKNCWPHFHPDQGYRGHSETVEFYTWIHLTCISRQDSNATTILKVVLSHPHAPMQSQLGIRMDLCEKNDYS